MVPDFSGYVTRYGVKCTDNRTILAHAFKHMDGKRVPLVWNHNHTTPDAVLGHVVLQHRDEGVWGDAYFNQTPQAQNAKVQVDHGDIEALSIYANQLQERNGHVQHGNIRETSLVLAGANSEARIDPVSLRHGDGTIVDLDDEAIIYLGVLEHAVSAETDSDNDGDNDADASEDTDADMTIQDVIDSMSDAQKDAMYALVGQALDHNATTSTGDLTHSADNKEGNTDVSNVFDRTDDKSGAPASGGYTLTHADQKAIFADAQRSNGSLRAALDRFALSHGVSDIETLFPEYKAVANTPEFIARRRAWVNTVLNGVNHTPFARIKQLFADITMDEARAKGYVKGNMKTEEWFSVSKRTTDPKTVYKKQKLDRDDILDITDFDLVNWVQGEMRVMLDEEVARAILFGDGRTVGDPDKIDEDRIRPIATDHDLYTTKVTINTAATGYDATHLIDTIVQEMRWYYGSGSPTLFCTYATLSSMLLVKDTLGHRIYPTKADLLAAMPGVGDIQTCEVLESDTTGLMGVLVNLSDYNVGTNNGGEVTPFTFFDIDYNQEKFLLETRFSGALVKYKAALAFYADTTSSDALVVPTKPTFNPTTGVATIPTKTGVVYKNDAGTTLTAGAQTALAAGGVLTVQATPASGYYIQDSATSTWVFTRDGG